MAPEQANETMGGFRPLTAATGSSAGSAAASVGTSRWRGSNANTATFFTLPLFASDSSFILKGMATIPFFLSLLGEINQIIHLSCLAECLTHNKPLF